jgi:phosphatidylinositol kinase/protein kinase (PI-3  family)
VFKNIEATAPPVFIIFKVGDDLRQDIFTLQLIRIMDRVLFSPFSLIVFPHYQVWKNCNYDLRLSPYRVTATGDMKGMVEVVLDSETTGKIMKDAGGTLGVMRDDAITNFLKANNPTRSFIFLFSFHYFFRKQNVNGNRHKKRLCCRAQGTALRLTCLASAIATPTTSW